MNSLFSDAPVTQPPKLSNLAPFHLHCPHTSLPVCRCRQIYSHGELERERAAHQSASIALMFCKANPDYVEEFGEPILPRNITIPSYTLPPTFGDSEDSSAEAAKVHDSVSLPVSSLIPLMRPSGLQTYYGHVYATPQTIPGAQAAIPSRTGMSSSVLPQVSLVAANPAALGLRSTRASAAASSAPAQPISVAPSQPIAPLPVRSSRPAAVNPLWRPSSQLDQIIKLEQEQRKKTEATLALLPPPSSAVPVAVAPPVPISRIPPALQSSISALPTPSLPARPASAIKPPVPFSSPAASLPIIRPPAASSSARKRRRGAGSDDEDDGSDAEEFESFVEKKAEKQSRPPSTPSSSSAASPPTPSSSVPRKRGRPSSKPQPDVCFICTSRVGPAKDDDLDVFRDSLAKKPEPPKDAPFTNPENFLLKCTQCSRFAHADYPCQNPTLITIPVKHRASWECADCTLCIKCRKDVDEELVLICEKCARSFHTYCSGIKEIPDGDWSCDECMKDDELAAAAAATAKAAAAAPVEAAAAPVPMEESK